LPQGDTQEVSGTAWKSGSKAIFSVLNFIPNTMISCYPGGNLAFLVEINHFCLRSKKKEEQVRATFLPFHVNIRCKLNAAVSGHDSCPQIWPIQLLRVLTED
uniref:Uncharacterized protein n=1 Tax=Dromaius novaehollandiae TaxID=8790 RepID=A0A8C4IXG4_DRONO